MKNCIVLLFSIFIFSCGENAPQTVATPADLTGFTVVEIPGSSLQKAQRLDAGGNVLEEGELLDGKKTGAWITYHSGGSVMVQSIANYVNGMKNGLFMEVNNRNQVQVYGYYANDLKDGKWVKYNYSRREWEEEYQNGQLHGVKRTFYNTGKDGQVKEEVEYKNGKQDGAYRYYLEDGTVSIDYVYKNGEIVERKKTG